MAYVLQHFKMFLSDLSKQHVNHEKQRDAKMHKYIPSLFVIYKTTLRLITMISYDHVAYEVMS